MSIQEDLEKKFRTQGFKDFKWINPKNIVVSQWVRMKCTYGCPDYGNKATCPPNTPSVAECERFFGEYENAVIFRFEKQLDDPETLHKWSKTINMKLLKLEKRIFLEGYFKTFLLPMDSCYICKKCSNDLEDCKHPELSRPTPEGTSR